MDRGTWRATVHGVAESETTEHARRCRYMQGFLGGLACSVSESVKCAFPILMKFKKSRQMLGSLIPGFPITKPGITSRAPARQDVGGQKSKPQSHQRNDAYPIPSN